MLSGRVKHHLKTLKTHYSLQALVCGLESLCFFGHRMSIAERGTFVYRDGELVPKHLASPLVPCGARSGLAAPHLISDTADAFRSMADGRLYDSKSSYRAELKRQGLREIGNDIEGHLKDVEATAPQKPKAKADIVNAYQKVKQGYKPPPGPPLDPDLD